MLLTPPGYNDLTPEQKADICNGCGARGWGWLVPDKIAGVDFTEPCDKHDYSWHIGLPKDVADKMLLCNLRHEAKKARRKYRWLAEGAAVLYYLVVKHVRGPYNENKEIE